MKAGGKKGTKSDPLIFDFDITPDQLVAAIQQARRAAVKEAQQQPEPVPPGVRKDLPPSTRQTLAEKEEASDLLAQGRAALLREAATSGGRIASSRRGGSPGRLTFEEAKKEAEQYQTHAAYRAEALQEASDAREEGHAAQRAETSKKGSGARSKQAKDRDARRLDDLVALVAGGETVGDSIAAKLGVSARKLDDLWKEGVRCGRLAARPHGRPGKTPRR